MSDIEKVAEGVVVIIHFTLKDESGKVLDTSDGDEPMPYLHGYDNIVPGLEAALEDKKVGDKLSVVVPPEEGYGFKSGAADQAIPRDSFPADMEVEPEMQFFGEGDEGMVPIWVTRVTDDTVYITLDHPLAGASLHFDVEVVALRAANAEELEHGHPHGLTGEEGHDH